MCQPNLPCQLRRKEKQIVVKTQLDLNGRSEALNASNPGGPTSQGIYIWVPSAHQRSYQWACSSSFLLSAKKGSNILTRRPVSVQRTERGGSDSQNGSKHLCGQRGNGNGPLPRQKGRLSDSPTLVRDKTSSIDVVQIAESSAQLEVFTLLRLELEHEPIVKKRAYHHQRRPIFERPW